jgi:hypothetical protein
MDERKVYLCHDCKSADSPCIAVTEGDAALVCLHATPHESPAWWEADPVIAAGILSALAEEQRGRC